MPIESHPVWSFEPEWSSSVSEILEWLTDVMASPDGSEQRRSLRLYPRRTLEFSMMASDDERQLFDNMLISFGGAQWYLPLWYEVNLLDAQANSGSQVVACSDAVNGSRIEVGGIAYMASDSAFEYELVEIASLTPSGFTTVSPLIRTWPAGTRVLPVCVAELTDQPQPRHRTSNFVTAEIRFRVMDTYGDVTSDPAAEYDATYRGFFVMAIEPDTDQRTNLNYERMFVEIDNQTSNPYRIDEAQRAFAIREHVLKLEGRSEHAAFARMIQTLRGRAKPVWVPTYMDDFILASAIVAGASTIEVGRCGFTAAGGPRWDREHIMIETVNGDRIYRRITSSSEGISGEQLTLDQPISTAYPVSDVLRISAMTLMRLNSDTVQIDHEVDNVGVSMSKLIFRSAPDTRVPLPAFDG